MKTLGLCMIVKDGERYIEQCIEAILPALSEIIIVDTGSTDATLEKIKRFNPKVYEMEWHNDFSAARNLSIQHATSDYIIVLDADEVIYAEDVPKLIETIQKSKADCITFRFHNLTSENDESIFNIHEGMRIFKRGTYHYEGKIHEQPVFNTKNKGPVLEHSGVRIKHYGYLKSNANEKKFERNMTILKEVLKEKPDEPFHLFNMGNQYMSIGDYETALTYFERANELKDIKLAYSPHLLYRRASCLKKLRRNEACLKAIAEGLKLYPRCTDLEYLRGMTLNSMKRFTMAIESFQRCTEMGMAPQNLCFFADTGTVLPVIEIAEIYTRQEDYQNALNYFLKALRMDGKRYYLIYKVATTLNQLYEDKAIVYQKLTGLFADASYRPNVMVMTDALINENLMDLASKMFHGFLEKNNGIEDEDILFLQGRFLFYEKRYDEAFLKFQQRSKPETPKGILPNMAVRTGEYQLACSLAGAHCREDMVAVVDAMAESLEKKVYSSFLGIAADALEASALDKIEPILSRLLRVEEYDVFENALNILNLVDSTDILLCLAEVYFKNHYHDMAVKTIVRSIKEFESLNSKAVLILNKEFLQ